MKLQNLKKLNLMRTMIFSTIILCFLSCKTSNPKQEENMNTEVTNENSTGEQASSDVTAIKEKSDKFFTLDKVVIIIAGELDPNSNKLNIQDYVENGKSFIPVFSSDAKFKESTKGADLGKKIIEINPLLLLSTLSGTETIRVNPSLTDEAYFQASDLKLAYKDEIDSFVSKMKK